MDKTTMFLIALDCLIIVVLIYGFIELYFSVESLNKQLSEQFQTAYQNKIAIFIKDVGDYTTKNQTLVS